MVNVTVLGLNRTEPPVEAPGAHAQKLAESAICNVFKCFFWSLGQIWFSLPFLTRKERGRMRYAVDEKLETPLSI